MYQPPIFIVWFLINLKPLVYHINCVKLYNVCSFYRGKIIKYLPKQKPVQIIAGQDNKDRQCERRSGQLRNCHWLDWASARRCKIKLNLLLCAWEVLCAHTSKATSQTAQMLDWAFFRFFLCWNRQIHTNYIKMDILASILVNTDDYGLSKCWEIKQVYLCIWSVQL